MLCTCIDEQRKVFETFCAERYGVVLAHLRDTLQLFIHATRYTLAYHVLHTKHMESLIGQMAQCGQDDTVLPSTYPVHRSPNEVNPLGADVQVVSCHCYLVVFHLFVEQLASHLL